MGFGGVVGVGMEWETAEDCRRIARHLTACRLMTPRQLGTATGRTQAVLAGGKTQHARQFPLLLCLKSVLLAAPQVSEFN